MDKEEIIRHLKNFFLENANRFGIGLAFFYGSWVKGFPREDSDIDIAIVFSMETPSVDEFFRRITEISLLLSRKLNLEVNIIQIYEDFRKPMLYYNAIVQSIPVYIRNHEKYIRLRNEAIYHMEDFSILGLRWQHEVALKNLEDLEHA